MAELLTNGLQTVVIGNFDNDPDQDTVCTLAEVYNEAVTALDPILPQVADLLIKMEQVEATGLLDGYLDAGEY